MDEEFNSLSILQIQNLMFATLWYKGNDLDSTGDNFHQYGYKGRMDDLFRLMDLLAVKENIIKKQVKVQISAWGATRDIMISGSNTNFNNIEIKRIYETFYSFLYKGILSPGAGAFSTCGLPDFHVTEYGMKCLKLQGILPYDTERYLNRINEIEGINEWTKYYIQQSLDCFNSNCYEASLVMIGLASESIVIDLIKSFRKYIMAKGYEEVSEFDKENDRCKNISSKYKIYIKYFKKIYYKDERLKGLNKYADNLTREVFTDYLRITRNELAHPFEIKRNREETLAIFIAFLEHCKKQYIYINYYNIGKGGNLYV